MANFNRYSHCIQERESASALSARELGLAFRNLKEARALLEMDGIPQFLLSIIFISSVKGTIFRHLVTSQLLTYVTYLQDENW
jgi:hypothetical protein